jgi:hypothetical protein
MIFRVVLRITTVMSFFGSSSVEHCRAIRNCGTASYNAYVISGERDHVPTVHLDAEQDGILSHDAQTHFLDGFARAPRVRSLERESARTLDDEVRSPVCIELEFEINA